MPYWEYEYFLKFANEQIKEENERQGGEDGDYSMDSIQRNANSMMKRSQSQIPKMPSMPKMPSISMPRI